MCPFVDKAHTRCASHMTLADIAHAFAYCADDYVDCPVYRELIADGYRRNDADLELPLLAAS